MGRRARTGLGGLVFGTLVLAWSGCGDDEAVTDAAPAVDDGAVVDAAVVDAAVADAAPDAAADAAADATPPLPTLTLTVSRFDASTALPPVVALASARTAAGQPWSGDVVMTAASPTTSFTPTISAVTAVGGGDYRAVVSAPQSGEVTITAAATIDGHEVSAEATVIFLPFISPEWGVPRALTSVNTAGPEDSIAISPDGQTLFFSYMPLEGCNIMPAGLGDDPVKAECREPAYPIGTPERPCTNGIGSDGKVTLGLFGDTVAWPWPKGLYNTYVAHRNPDGSFANPQCITFADDGTILEVGPSSGPANPVPGEPYDLFFGYPDWLNIDQTRDGTVFAVATVTAGESVDLSDPITAISATITNNLVTSLTGDIDDVRENAEQIGEFRVHYNPIAANHELYFEAKQADETMDIVVSPLEGTYPVGDWGAATKVPGEVNTDVYAEGFPWLVELPGEGLHLFFNRAPEISFSEPMAVYDSTWAGDQWATPIKVIDIPPTGDPGGVLLVALPSVAVGDFGVELFFVYVLTYPSGKLNFQLGVIPRVAD